MSLEFSVYVGPFVVAYGTRGAVERELLESFDDILMDGRGEAGAGDDRLYVIPNIELSQRETSWERSESDKPPVSVTAQEMLRELRHMTDLANTFIAAIESAGGTCNVEWGIVCQMM